MAAGRLPPAGRRLACGPESLFTQNAVRQEVAGRPAAGAEPAPFGSVLPAAGRPELETLWLRSQWLRKRKIRLARGGVEG